MDSISYWGKDKYLKSVQDYKMSALDHQMDRERKFEQNGKRKHYSSTDWWDGLLCQLFCQLLCLPVLGLQGEESHETSQETSSQVQAIIFYFLCWTSYVKYIVEEPVPYHVFSQDMTYQGMVY